jgi:hypothetical protein
VQECYVGIIMTKDRNEFIKKENQSFNKLTKSKDLLLRNLTLKTVKIEREDSSSRMLCCLSGYSKFFIATVNVGMNHTLLTD